MALKIILNYLHYPASQLMENSNQDFLVTIKQRLRKFRRWIKSLPSLVILFIVLISLPFSLFLVQQGIKFLSRAAVTANVYFTPASADLPPNQTMRIMIDAGTNQIGFAAIQATFNPSLIRLNSEIQTTSLLSNVVLTTTMAEANSTGVINVVLALCHPDVNCSPTPSPVTGLFELANFQITSNTSQNDVSTSINFNNNAIQLVELITNPSNLNFTLQNASLLLNSTGATPTPGGGAVISNLQVFDSANSTDWSVQSNLAVGNRQYGDRNFTFTTIPSSYLGLEWIRTANDSKVYSGNPVATFTVNPDATVLVAYDDRITTKPGWFTGWTDTGQNIVNSEPVPVTFSVFSRSYNSGQTVSLGPSGGPGGSSSMYTVMASPDAAPPTPTPTTQPTPTPTTQPTPTPTSQPPTPTPTTGCLPPPGDGNGDCAVNGTDYVIWLVNYGRQGPPPLEPIDGDYFDDDDINGTDYVVWLVNYTG
jgi:hypothetical protein